jgi:hypothetical protein
MLLGALQHVVVDKLPSQGTGVLAYVPVVTVLLAMISAYFSFRSVSQARMVWRLSLDPQLVPRLRTADAKLHLEVVNAGKSVAAQPGWAVLWAERRMEGLFADVAVAPDKVTSAETFAIRSGEDTTGAQAIVWCRGTDGGLLVWSTLHGQARRLGRSQIRGRTPVDLLAVVLTDKARAASDATAADERVGAL